MVMRSGNVLLVLSFDIQCYWKKYWSLFYKVAFCITWDIYSSSWLAKESHYTVETLFSGQVAKWVASQERFCTYFWYPFMCIPHYAFLFTRPSEVVLWPRLFFPEGKKLPRFWLTSIGFKMWFYKTWYKYITS